MAGSSSIGNWQSELDTSLSSSREKGDFMQFMNMATDAERIKFIHDRKLLSNVEWIIDYFTTLSQLMHRKNSDRSQQHKEEGNKLFTCGKDQQALAAYTQSMQFAVSTVNRSDDLAFAYGNRSAVLFRLNRYRECLTDIQRASDSSLPSHSLHRLMVRRCLCYLRLGQELEAVKVKEQIVRMLETVSDQKTKEYLENELIKIEKEIHLMKKKFVLGQVSKSVTAVSVPTVSYGANSMIVQASSVVELRTSSCQGRFLQAKHAISAGDTLIVERPYAAVLLPPYYDSHCHQCFALLPVNPIGCCRCSRVLYCDESCRDASWECYHAIECCYTDLLHSVGIAHLSLRIVLTAGLRYLMEFLRTLKQKEMKSPNRIPGLTATGRYERNYLAVYDLMTHTSDMQPGDLFQYSLTASLLLAILLHAGWFCQEQDASLEQLDRNSLVVSYLHGELDKESDHTSAPLDMSQVFTVGGILLRHVQQLVCNAHAITAVLTTQVDKGGSVETQSQVRVATAIYPTASLMNHSCDPTIISSFQKDVLIVKSVKNVSAGGEIFNCYGPHCKRMNRQERQEQLRTQYFFDCICDACTRATNSSDLAQGLKCPLCEKTLPLNGGDIPVCPACHMTVDMTAILSQLEIADESFRRGVQLLDEGDYKRAVKKFDTCLEVRSRLMTSTNHDLGQVHDAVAQCLASMGHYGEAVKHLSQSLIVTEAVFGTNSVETARELHKLAEVQINAGQPRDALQSAARALDLARKLYSDSDSLVQELLCLKMALIRIIADIDQENKRG